MQQFSKLARSLEEAEIYSELTKRLVPEKYAEFLASRAPASLQ
jgi:hypothetical protein